MNDQILEIEIRLLILKYGRHRVLTALARLGEQSPEDLERCLEIVKQRRKAKRPRPSVMDLVATPCHEKPEIAEPLRAMALAFQNRTFLPQLRDVQRFLDRIGSAHGRLRSREAAAPALVRELAKMTRADLLRLVSETSSSSESDYALLARAIMGTPAEKPRDSKEPGTLPDKT